MIKLFGCSFTNWIYPTWADFTKLHYDCPVDVYGNTGIGNQTIKYLIALNTSTDDTVIAMFTGNDRLEIGVDKELLDTNGFVRKKCSALENYDKLRFKTKNTLFMQMKNNSEDHTGELSLFHFLNTQAEHIVDIQNQFEHDNLRFLSWQNLFGDLRNRKQRYGLAKNINLKQYLENPVFNCYYNKINQTQFLDNFGSGLLDFVHQDKQLFEYQNTWDFHPSCIAHFKYFCKYVKPWLDTKFDHKNNLTQLEQCAFDLSNWYKDVQPDEKLLLVKDDNDFVHDKFAQVRQSLINRFFKDYEQYLLH